MKGGGTKRFPSSGTKEVFCRPGLVAYWHTLFLPDSEIACFNGAVVGPVSSVRFTADEPELQLPKDRLLCVYVRRGELGIERPAWHAWFGLSEPNYCSVIRLVAESMQTSFLWTAH